MEQVDTSKTETNKATETISEVTETSLSVDVKNEENTSAPESLPETESANEPRSCILTTKPKRYRRYL